MDADCIGCGYCCRKGPCGIPDIEWSNGKCSELIWDNVSDRWMCRKISESTGEQRKMFARYLALGAGCCSPINTYRLCNCVPTPEELKHEELLLATLRAREDCFGLLMAEFIDLLVGTGRVGK